MRLGTQGEDAPDVLEISVVQEKCSTLEIRDADSGVLFDSEKRPLSRAQYDALKALVLKSAAEFLATRIFSGSYGEDWSLATALRQKSGVVTSMPTLFVMCSMVSLPKRESRSQ